MRAVLAKALDPGATGLRAELDPNGQQLQQLTASMSQLIASHASQQEEMRNFVKSSIAAAKVFALSKWFELGKDRSSSHGGQETQGAEGL